MNRTILKKIMLPLFLFFCIGPKPCAAQVSANTTVKLCVARLTHDHVGWILSRKKTDVVIAGIYEPDKALAEHYSKKYGFSMSLVYDDLDKMLNEIKPEAVAAFGSILEHAQVVELCAPKHIHVMVEKPLATTYEQALHMDSLAKEFNIQLLTNFETSWYATTAKAYQLANDSNYFGSINKVVVHDGHQGPKEIGVSNNFFEWLTDSIKNGGGALIDFGCYGANLMTYLMKGEQPISVTAVTKKFKPAIYPNVDDDATIILNYPSATCIIQASWNWPFGRKDMEVYGQTGYVITINNNNMRMRTQPDTAEHFVTLSPEALHVYTDPFTYLADVLRKKITVPENGLYALKTNVTVVRILSAARLSAKTGKTIYLQ